MTTTKDERRPKGDGGIYWNTRRARHVMTKTVDGRRRTVSGTSKSDVVRKMKDVVANARKAKEATATGTVDSLMAAWLPSLPKRDKPLAPSTIERHHWAASRLGDEIGAMPLSALTVNVVEAAFDGMAESSTKPLARSSLVQIRSTIRQALQWAQRREMVLHNAAIGALIPATAAPAEPRRALTPDELVRLMDALRGHPLAPMFFMIARVGLRPGEAAALCGDALDLDAAQATLSIERGIQLKRGRPLLVDSLKNKFSIRVIALPDDVVGVARLLEGGEGLLFTAADGGPLWPSTVRAELAQAAERAGLHRVRPHELRHTAATMMRDAGLTPEEVADILGHRSTRMVEEVYRGRPAVIRGAERVRLLAA